MSEEFDAIYPSMRNLTGMTLHEALAAMGLLGSVHGEPADLSTNPKHMEGFGEHERGID